jgi:hypothetical protein
MLRRNAIGLASLNITKPVGDKIDIGRFEYLRDHKSDFMIFSTPKFRRKLKGTILDYLENSSTLSPEGRKLLESFKPDFEKSKLYTVKEKKLYNSLRGLAIGDPSIPADAIVKSLAMNYKMGSVTTPEIRRFGRKLFDETKRFDFKLDPDTLLLHDDGDLTIAEKNLALKVLSEMDPKEYVKLSRKYVRESKSSVDKQILKNNLFADVHGIINSYSREMFGIEPKSGQPYHGIQVAKHVQVNDALNNMFEVIAKLEYQNNWLVANALT